VGLAPRQSVSTFLETSAVADRNTVLTDPSATDSTRAQHDSQRHSRCRAPDPIGERNHAHAAVVGSFLNM
jgi:hypothetical protein